MLSYVLSSEYNDWETVMIIFNWKCKFMRPSLKLVTRGLFLMVDLLLIGVQAKLFKQRCPFI